MWFKIGEKLSKIKRGLYTATAGVVTGAFLVANAGYASAEQTRVGRPEETHISRFVSNAQPSLDQKLTEPYNGIESHILQEAEMPFIPKSKSHAKDTAGNASAYEKSFSDLDSPSRRIYAINSLFKPDDVERMKKAGISDRVIQKLMVEQTCSVTADYLIKLKNAGADDDMLREAILTDRYKIPGEVTSKIWKNYPK